MPLSQPMQMVDRLRALGRTVRETIIASRQTSSGRNNPGDQGGSDKAPWSAVDRASSADTIYRIDAAIEPVLEDFFRDWGKSIPLVLIAEGFVDFEGREGPKVFPEGKTEQDAALRIIVDPIDGTRGIMYDKRSAWMLAGGAPNKGSATKLSDILAAVMTELPTSKMGRADVLWAVRGGGAHGVREPLRGGNPAPLRIGPSTATDLRHGFASVCNFFPGIKQISAEMMEFIAARLLGPADVKQAAIFDDQYISTGGQWYEMIVGHDRFIADPRPLLYRLVDQPPGLCCHPYDCAAQLVATEAGVIITNVLGQPLNGPLDTTTDLSWAAYANKELQKQIEPLIMEFLAQRGWSLQKSWEAKRGSEGSGGSVKP